MSQHPRSVPSGSGLAVREGFNNALDSAFTLNSGPTAPASPQAGLLWLDTATGVLKIRNDANTAWVDLADRLAALRHDAAQTLTSGQKQQVRSNIGALSYDAQSLTNAQRQQARDNIGAGAVATESVVPLSKGGTGATTAEGARAAIGAGGPAFMGVVANFNMNAGVVMTNPSSSRPLFVDINATSAAQGWVELYTRSGSSAGWGLIGKGWSNSHASTSGIVPPGWQYKMESTATVEVRTHY